MCSDVRFCDEEGLLCRLRGCCGAGDCACLRYRCLGWLRIPHSWANCAHEWGTRFCGGTRWARTLIRAGHLLDVATGAEAAGQTIIVTGDKVAGIAATDATPAGPGDMVIDLGKLWVLPGLIDVHTHLTMANNFDPYWELTMTPAKEGIIGTENAKVTLEAGFTTVRNVGANDFADVALRDEINAGHMPGPHMQVSGPPLGITGGHMDNNLLPYEYHDKGEGVADGIARCSRWCGRTSSTGRT